MTFSMTARFNGGKCQACPKPIRKGDPIMYDKEQRVAWHSSCFTESDEPRPGDVELAESLRFRQEGPWTS